jgi:GH24 family phage-related lysozyme (muramidase)
MIFTETTAYISVLLITITALWTIVAYPKNYLFKTIFIPVILFVGFSLFETYQSILGYATTADPPEKIQYIYHVKQDNFIFLLIRGDNGTPRMYKLVSSEELDKALNEARKKGQSGVTVFGRMEKNKRAGEKQEGGWIMYEMPFQEMVPKDYEEKNMETSENGIELIKEFEGKRQVAYQDEAGVWTIGYGHTKDVYKGQLIIESRADKMLAEDLKVYEGIVNEQVKVPLNQNQFDALVSWTFNLGEKNLKKSTMLKKLNEGDFDSVPTEMKRWNIVAGKVSKGLINRREAEVSLFLA